MKNIKTIVIFALILTALIQLSNIWNIKVFDMFSSNEISVEDDYKQEILLPSEVLVKENDLYRIAFYTKENDAINKSVLNILKEVGETGVLQETEKTIDELILNADVIYEYGYIIDSDLISEVFGNKNNIFEQYDVVFNYIFINSLGNEVNFYNAETQKNYSFTVENINIEKDYVFNDNFAFVYNDDDSNYLTPQVISNECIKLEEENPYSENNEILISTVESKINQFFVDPNEKWTIFGEDSYIFSGEDITVKYYNNNILEYRNSYSSKNKVDEATAYAIAKSFIEEDELVTNDLILKDVVRDENSYIFYFNPIVNNTEVIFDNDFIDYYMEVEVTNGIVSKYKKYVMNYDESTSQTEIIEKSLDIKELEEHFDSVSFGYLQDFDNNITNLSWAMTFGDETVYTAIE